MIIAVNDSSQVSVARRATSSLARGLLFDEEGTSRSALLATELATNLLKHAGGGEMLLGQYQDAGRKGLELIALDKGPGIDDLPKAMEDGHSTAGGMGGGLGAIRRQSDNFAFYSKHGLGTAVMVRVHDRKKPSPRAVPGPRVALGAAAAPLAGEGVSGDDWAFAATRQGPTLMSVDGSGHGTFANAAAAAAVAAFGTHAEQDCPRLVEQMHLALKPTRGGAVAVARVDVANGLLRFVGVGNIAALLLSEGKTQRMVSHNGVLGLAVPRIREFTYPFTGVATVILHSDGLSSRWDLASYPGLSVSHPSLIAAVLFRDHRRGRDDAAIAVMRVG